MDNVKSVAEVGQAWFTRLPYIEIFFAVHDSDGILTWRNRHAFFKLIADAWWECKSCFCKASSYDDFFFFSFLLIPGVIRFYQLAILLCDKL